MPAVVSLKMNLLNCENKSVRDFVKRFCSSIFHNGFLPSLRVISVKRSKNLLTKTKESRVIVGCLTKS